MSFGHVRGVLALLMSGVCHALALAQVAMSPMRRLARTATCRQGRRELVGPNQAFLQESAEYGRTFFVGAKASF
jgi:hypothetical protein